MKVKAVASVVALSLLLAGCGSDSDAPVKPPKPAEPDPLQKYVAMEVDHQPIVDKIHKVAVGRFDDKVKAWIHGPDGADLDGDGKITVEDAHLYGDEGIFNEALGYEAVSSKEILAFLESNVDGLGKHSARPDIFVEGQYSVFDVLRYLVHTDDQLRFESVTQAKDSPLHTTEFVLSYDANNDGDFGNDGEYSDSRHWFYRFKNSAGEFRRAIGEPDGEANYKRMDEMWAQNDMAIRFQPFNEVMTARRGYLWRKEINRLEANGGKYVVSEIRVQKEGESRPSTYVQNLEVTAHNLRPDVFQPGVITAADIFMSAIDAGYDFKFSYWPTLDTGANVYSYSVFRADGLESTTGKGWLTYFGENEAAGDFHMAAPKCLWNKEGETAAESAFPVQDCFQDFQFRFGGNMLHLMTDVWVMPYPKEYALLRYATHYPMFSMEEYNGDKGSKEYDFSPEQDGSDVAVLETLKLETDPDSRTILTSGHYGWGVANCMLCHNVESGHANGAPLPVNSGDGFDQPQPYYCATCHGGNGAMEGHGATARCFWCHSESKTPQYHGDAYELRTVNSILDKLDAEKSIYTKSPAMTHPRDASGNRASYTTVTSATNSDRSMSKTFPDPYSCMTCHPNN